MQGMQSALQRLLGFRQGAGVEVGAYLQSPDVLEAPVAHHVLDVDLHVADVLRRLPLAYTDGAISCAVDLLQSPGGAVSVCLWRFLEGLSGCLSFCFDSLTLGWS